MHSRKEVRLHAVYPPRRLPRVDDGFFGPDSITWTIHSHPVALVGLIRNTLYSALLSEVSQALVEHGKTLIDPIARGQETAYALYTMVFGDTAEATRAGQYTQGKHAKVKGHDPVSGTEYAPLRTDLAIAAHGIIWESYLIPYETYVAKLTDAEREQYWCEGFAQAELIGIEPAVLPQTWQDWRSYFDAKVFPRLSYSAAANSVVSYRMGASYVDPIVRPIFLLEINTIMELLLATVGPVERALFGRPRSRLRIAATQFVGRQLLAVAGHPNVGDRIIGGFSDRAAELIREAREMRAATTTTTHSLRVDRDPLIPITRRPKVVLTASDTHHFNGRRTGSSTVRSPRPTKSSRCDAGTPPTEPTS